MKPAHAIAVCLAAAVPAALAGCGGSSADRAAGRPGAVALTEYAFVPRNVSVRRGGVLDVVNDGQIGHNLTVRRSLSSTASLAATGTLLPGSSESLKVDLAPGRYAIVCTVPGHEERGMVGTLRVRPVPGGGGGRP